MKNNKKLAIILGSYIDDESEVFYLTYNLYNEGLKCRIYLNHLNLFTGFNINILDIIENNFLIIDSNSKVRGLLNKPFIFTDEDYIFEFYTNSYSLKMEFNYNEQKKIDFKLNKHNFLILQEIFSQGFVDFKIIRKKTGQLVSKVSQKEFFHDTDLYAEHLKKLIYNSFYSLSSSELRQERIKLWDINLKDLNEYDLLYNDFGIKNLQKLEQIYIHFKFLISNKKLLDIDVQGYQNSLENFYKNIKKNNFILNP